MIIPPKGICANCCMKYDLSGNLLEKAEPIPAEDGRQLFCRTSYTCDGYCRQTGVCFDGGKWILVEDETGRRLEEAEPGKALRLSCSYDARGRLIQVTDGTGACVRYAYDVRGNRIKEEQTISDVPIGIPPVGGDRRLNGLFASLPFPAGDQLPSL